MTKTIYDPDSGRMVEVESIFDGRRLPWQSDSDPAFKGTGAMQGMVNGRAIPFERRQRPNAPQPALTKRCEQCGEIFSRPPAQSKCVWFRRKFCSKVCAAFRTRKQPAGFDARREAIQREGHLLTWGQLSVKYGVSRSAVRLALSQGAS